MFKPMMQELLNIKQFRERKFKKIKTMFFKGDWGKLLVLQESP